MAHEVLFKKTVSNYKLGTIYKILQLSLFRVVISIDFMILSRNDAFGISNTKIINIGDLSGKGL